MLNQVLAIHIFKCLSTNIWKLLIEAFNFVKLIQSFKCLSHTLLNFITGILKSIIISMPFQSIPESCFSIYKEIEKMYSITWFGRGKVTHVVSLGDG